MSHLSSPSSQIEYEIFLLSSQAESLLKDLDRGKALNTFKDNIAELHKCQAIVSAIITTIKKDL